MRNSFQILAAASLAMGIAFAGGAAQAKDFKVLHSFCKNTHRVCGDGSNPQAGLVMDAAGNFYSTTATAGRGAGTVFELERKPSGSFNFKTLYRFCSSGLCGRNPSGALVVDTAGNLYGTATSLVFELLPGGKKGQWTEKVLHRFCSDGCGDGNDAVGGLTYAGASSGAPYDGTSPLYGVTQLGGTNNGGTVLQLTNSGGTWSESVLYDFCTESGGDCLDGKAPHAGVILNAAGNLYGTTFQGGGNNVGNDKNGAGIVFQLAHGGDRAWSETVLHRFCSVSDCADGANPEGELVFDAAGNLYGTTLNGLHCAPDNLFGCGTVYRLSPNGSNWQQSVLYVFCQKSDCSDGQSPEASLVLGASGELNGTTTFGGGNDIDENGIGGGVAFKLSSGSFNLLHRFCSSENCSDGEYPKAGLTRDATGLLYGTTVQGGQNGGGTAFRTKP